MSWASTAIVQTPGGGGGAAGGPQPGHVQAEAAGARGGRDQAEGGQRGAQQAPEEVISYSTAFIITDKTKNKQILQKP